MTQILQNFWVLEGLDGAGTTTQLKNIEAELKTREIPSYITCEPTTYETGVFLRKILSGEVKASQAVIAMMFATDRQNHLDNPQTGIYKQLSENKIVVSDRYLFSSLAYQSIGFDYDSVKKINSLFPYPQYVIYIDTPPEDCLKRIESRGNEKEIYEKLDYQKKVRENYEKCFSNLPEGCNLIRINGLLSKEEVFEKIKSVLFSF